MHLSHRNFQTNQSIKKASFIRMAKLMGFLYHVLFITCGNISTKSQLLAPNYDKNSSRDSEAKFEPIKSKVFFDIINGKKDVFSNCVENTPLVIFLKNILKKSITQPHLNSKIVKLDDKKKKMVSKIKNTFSNSSKSVNNYRNCFRVKPDGNCFYYSLLKSYWQIFRNININPIFNYVLETQLKTDNHKYVNQLYLTLKPIAKNICIKNTEFNSLTNIDLLIIIQYLKTLIFFETILKNPNIYSGFALDIPVNGKLLTGTNSLEYTTNLNNLYEWIEEKDIKALHNILQKNFIIFKGIIKKNKENLEDIYSFVTEYFNLEFQKYAPIALLLVEDEKHYYPIFE